MYTTVAAGVRRVSTACAVSSLKPVRKNLLSQSMVSYYVYLLTIRLVRYAHLLHYYQKEKDTIFCPQADISQDDSARNLKIALHNCLSA